MIPLEQSKDRERGDVTEGAPEKVKDTERKELIGRQGWSWFWSSGGIVCREIRWQQGPSLACTDGLVALKA